MSEKYIPVLVGVGQVTEREVALDGSSVLDLIERAVYRAADDASISKKALADLDTLAIVRSFRESTRNTPEALANRIGAARARQWLMPNGGNGPQYLVNHYAGAIANGECQFALFAGAEAMATSRKIVKETGEQPAWQEPASGDPEYLVPDSAITSPHEQQHGILTPSWVYAMHENALRRHLGRSPDDHQIELGRLFSKFTEVAAQSPHAWYPVRRSPEEIAYPSEKNRMVAWPYTKYMNAMNQINQSAALLFTSVDYARKLGISEDRFVYLHGCSDTKEKPVSTRPNYYQSDAMRVMAEQAFAGDLDMDDMKYIDFYSCFPVAVEFACHAFGVKPGDPRALTVTGGLPFHGGAGNNYVMNSIATMADKVRADRGSYGLVTANGGYFSKHAAGVYSTNPVEGEWCRTHPSEYQSEIDDLPDTPFTETPEGAASIETYTLVYNRDNQPGQGFVIGRLGDADDPGATRFLSVVGASQGELKAMTGQDMIGTAGSVAQVDGVNTFKLA